MKKYRNTKYDSLDSWMERIMVIIFCMIIAYSLLKI